MSAEVRSDILDFLSRELIGPDPGFPAQQLNREEILRPQDPPRLRYSAGVLFPRKAAVAQAENSTEIESDAAASEVAEGEEPDNDDTGLGDSRADARGEGEVPTEQEVNRANEFLPSAMGISALVRLPKLLKIRVSAGHYEALAVAGLGRQNKDEKWVAHWWRKPVEVTLEIDCTEFFATEPKVRVVSVEVDGNKTGLAMHIFSRPFVHAKEPDRERIITFTLLNEKQATSTRAGDEECFFQCHFGVIDGDGGDCFLEYPERVGLAEDEEEESLRLLFDHRKTFAVGHGCAANWPDGEAGVMSRVWTESLPCHEIKPITPTRIEGLDLSMAALAGDKDVAIGLCQQLAEAYEQWIGEQAKKIRTLAAEHRVAAERHLNDCRRGRTRMLAGIESLRTDSDTQRAFALMNEAMLQQQFHYELASSPTLQRNWIKSGQTLVLERSYEAPNITAAPPEKGRWRPFQLAFILMNLRSMTERDSDERKIVDLIWFPTGGGKTEAYLGLTAFTIFWRRLENPENSGTTALMRYTLRLLTTQQYQRAASLICACELLRRANTDELGVVPISIGLWVGGDVTPIRHADAVKRLQELLDGGWENPFIMLNCPWCGAQMGSVEFGRANRVKGYIQRQAPQRVEFCCEDPNCDFREGLPLYVVDEAIYSERPTLLIGTVDKFALLPWYPQARQLFGLDTGGDISPPDLVIQDELHLISGPLGSMVGHYETVLDALCTADEKGKQLPAKIIASTATICRAAEQVRSLYARGVFLFPPQGLRAGDSFFAKEEYEQVGRIYVGVFATALSSHVTAQIRVISALLQGVKCVAEDAIELELEALRARFPGRQLTRYDVLDPYWTVMAYFNSLRELGHAATLIRADITDYLNAMWDRLQIRPDETTDPRRFINADRELTSRVQSSEIPEILQQLFVQWNGTRESFPIDVCLATNMIQVGLDVPRLGLMTVVGQPKMTSEYIQATSRVGRASPGLVVTVYNPAKPRDRSLFEHFRAYHQSIYRWVEPTSVTPFAVPVRDRALHALVVTLVRYLGGDASRANPQPPPDSELAKRVSDILLARVQDVDAEEAAETQRQLEELFDDWRRNPPPRYGDFRPPDGQTPLMFPTGTQKLAEWGEPCLPTPSSMRNVDSTCDAAVVPRFPEPEEV